jgi:alkylhydroperoxidase family enzyme
MTEPHFLGPAPESAAARKLCDADVDEVGYVMNNSRLWAHAPALHDRLFDQLVAIAEEYGLGVRERGILVAATAATIGDSYCSLAWGRKLAEEAGESLAAAVLRGTDEGLTEAERAMAAWARAVARDANATAPADVQALRDAGLPAEKILAVTTFVALRIAYATVNDALGALPDAQLRSTAPPAVLAAVTYGRPLATA